VKTLIFLCVATAIFACSGSDGPTGGPVSGAADVHCRESDGGVRVQHIDTSSCQAGGSDAGTLDYGQTMYNAEADDDDCKYHVKFTNTPVRQRTNVNFTVTATVKETGAAATGANLLAEVYLNDTHPAPNTNQQTTEQSGGTYVVGPVQFDAPGQWTVRFHLHDDCSDEPEDSPHGHAAFFIGVP
jgi:YtkA-like protein